MDSFFKDLEYMKPNDNLAAPQGLSVSTISKSPMNEDIVSSPYGYILSCLGKEAWLEGDYRSVNRVETSFSELVDFQLQRAVLKCDFSFEIPTQATGQPAVEMQALDDSDLEDCASQSESQDAESDSEILEFDAPFCKDSCGTDSSIDGFCAEDAEDDFRRPGRRQDKAEDEFSCELGPFSRLETSNRHKKHGGVYVTDVLVEEIDIEPLEVHLLPCDDREKSQEKSEKTLEELGVSNIAQSNFVKPEEKPLLNNKEETAICKRCTDSVCPPDGGSTLATRVTASSMYHRFSSLAQRCRCYLRTTRSVKRKAVADWPLKDVLVSTKATMESSRNQYGSLEF